MDNSIHQIFIQFLSQFRFEEKHLDYPHAYRQMDLLEILATKSNSGIQVFDLNKKANIFFSSNFSKVLGYEYSDFADPNYQFFADKIHPDERQQLALNGVATIKMFNAFSVEDKLSHKVVDEYRMLNARNQYVRVIEQYQVLELDATGQLWLLMSIVDISPNQEAFHHGKRQLLNFKTGNFVSLDSSVKPALDLTRRESEILDLVKRGYLSKEISNMLNISVHTVNTHRQRILEKLGANNSHEAVGFAGKFGLLG